MSTGEDEEFDLLDIEQALDELLKGLDPEEVEMITGEGVTSCSFLQISFHSLLFQ